MAQGQTYGTADAAIPLTLREDTTSTIIELTAAATGTLSGYDITEQPNPGQFMVSSGGVVTLASGQILNHEQDSELIIKVT